MRWSLFISLLSLAFSIQTITGQEMTFSEFVQIYNKKLAAQNLHLDNQLYDFIPRQIQQIRNEHIIAVNPFMSVEEAVRVQQSVPINVIENGKQVSEQLVNYIVKLNDIQTNILNGNLNIWNTINLKLPNEINPYFLEQFNSWFPNPLTQGQVDSIEDEIAITSIGCISLETDFELELIGIRPIKENINQRMQTARLAFDNILQATNLQMKLTIFRQIEALIATINNNFATLQTKQHHLLEIIYKYNNIRTYLAGVLIEESGESM